MTAPSAPASAVSALRALGDALLRLAVLAQADRPQTLLADAMEALRGAIAFDSAWWGEVSGGDAATAPRNWLHGSTGLRAGFADEWNALAPHDGFARLSMERLGAVVRERDALDGPPPHPAVEDFVRRHDLHHCMATTVDLPGSGLLFFVSVYRGAARAPFSDAEAAALQAFTAHLVCHWSHLLKRARTGSAPHPWDSYALADASGTLLFAGLRLGLALAAAFPGWAGAALPDGLAPAAGRLPRTVAAGGAHRFRLEPCGPLLAISLPSRHARPPLPPRELGAATLYAHGHSHKAIAAALGLTPATVRTYLRSAYAALGVRNKTELTAALRGG